MRPPSERYTPPIREKQTQEQIKSRLISPSPKHRGGTAVAHTLGDILEVNMVPGRVGLRSFWVLKPVSSFSATFCGTSFTTAICKTHFCQGGVLHRCCSDRRSSLLRSPLSNISLYILTNSCLEFGQNSCRLLKL